MKRVPTARGSAVARKRAAMWLVLANACLLALLATSDRTSPTVSAIALTIEVLVALDARWALRVLIACLLVELGLLVTLPRSPLRPKGVRIQGTVLYKDTRVLGPVLLTLDNVPQSIVTENGYFEIATASPSSILVFRVRDNGSRILDEGREVVITVDDPACRKRSTIAVTLDIFTAHGSCGEKREEGE